MKVDVPSPPPILRRLAQHELTEGVPLPGRYGALPRAVELMRFLALRHNQPVHSMDCFLGVSPGYEVDKLFHAMLLNTEVAETVWATLGYRVYHSTMEGYTDDEIMLRRLYALNIWKRELGHEPSLGLWDEAGTIMADIKDRIVARTVPGQNKPVVVSMLLPAVIADHDVLLLARAVFGPTDGIAHHVSSGVVKIVKRPRHSSRKGSDEFPLSISVNVEERVEHDILVRSSSDTLDHIVEQLPIRDGGYHGSEFRSFRQHPIIAYGSVRACGYRLASEREMSSTPCKGKRVADRDPHAGRPS